MRFSQHTKARWASSPVSALSVATALLLATPLDIDIELGADKRLMQAVVDLVPTALEAKPVRQGEHRDERRFDSAVQLHRHEGRDPGRPGTPRR